MKKITTVIIILVLLGIMVIFMFSSRISKTDDAEYYRGFREDYRVYSPELPVKVDFAGEEAPLDVYHVRESLDREMLVNTYWQTATMLIFKRAARWLPVIEPILKQNNIPDDFKYLAMAESGLTNTVSNKEAAGFWQLLAETARMNGLEVTDEVDERYHLEKATAAACKFFRDAYGEYGSWTLAAASYNAGRKRISDALKIQGVSNYYDLFLNEETSRFIFRILAIKTIYENPLQYGYYIRMKDLYPPFPVKEVSVDTTIGDMVAFSRKFNTSYRIFKELNPWTRSLKLKNPGRKTYVFKFPDDSHPGFLDLYKNTVQDEGLLGDTTGLMQNKD